MPKPKTTGVKRFLHSFRYAGQGVVQAYRTEQNMRVHTAVAVVVLAGAAVFRVPGGQFMLLLLAVTLVLAAELLNTAIEAVVDLVSPELHPLAKAAKDTAAGAVLLTALFAVAAGIYVFYRPVMDWIAGIVS